MFFRFHHFHQSPLFLFLILPTYFIQPLFPGESGVDQLVEIIKVKCPSTTTKYIQFIIFYVEIFILVSCGILGLGFPALRFVMTILSYFEEI